jgi:hypothetical protein
MSADPFIFKERRFTSLTRLCCYRRPGDIYAFVVNTRRHPERTYSNKLYVQGYSTPLTKFSMINIGYGKSLICFTDMLGDNICHEGQPGMVTLIVRSRSNNPLPQKNIVTSNQYWQPYIETSFNPGIFKIPHTDYHGIPSKTMIA